MIYYSHTHGKIKEYDFKTKKDTGNWDVPLKLSVDARAMIYLQWFEKSNAL
jgi:hypothetical protein